MIASEPPRRLRRRTLPALNRREHQSVRDDSPGMDRDARLQQQRIVYQNAEFDAVERLTEQYRRLTLTPVVDDDYPAVRHDYENALKALLQACAYNGRFMPQIKGAA